MRVYLRHTHTYTHIHAHTHTHSHTHTRKQTNTHKHAHTQTHTHTHTHTRTHTHSNSVALHIGAKTSTSWSISPRHLVVPHETQRLHHWREHHGHRPSSHGRGHTRHRARQQKSQVHQIPIHSVTTASRDGCVCIGASAEGLCMCLAIDSTIKFTTTRRYDPRRLCTGNAPS